MEVGRRIRKVAEVRMLQSRLSFTQSHLPPTKALVVEREIELDLLAFVATLEEILARNKKDIERAQRNATCLVPVDHLDQAANPL
jgi:hypothetical protein